MQHVHCTVSYDSMIEQNTIFVINVRPVVKQLCSSAQIPVFVCIKQGTKIWEIIQFVSNCKGWACGITKDNLLNNSIIKLFWFS